MYTSILPQLLRHKEKLYERLWSRLAVGTALAEFCSVALVGILFFGAVMAMQEFTFAHAWGIGWRLAAVLMGSALICLPSLFVFSALRGSTLTLRELVYLLSGNFATMAVVLVAVAPIVWFFTWTDTPLPILAQLHVGVIALASVFGLLFFKNGMQAAHTQRKATMPDSHPATVILLPWLLLVIIVGVQMSVKLSPWYR